MRELVVVYVTIERGTSNCMLLESRDCCTVGLEDGNTGTIEDDEEVQFNQEND